MKISRLIRDEQSVCLNFSAKSKDDLLSETIDWMVKTHALTELKDEIQQAILQREQLQSTVFDEGLWMPHARVDSLYRIFGVVGLCRDGIPCTDERSPLLHFLFMLIYPKNDETQHLHLMSKMMSFIHECRFREQWLQCQKNKDWISMMIQNEG